MVTDGIMTAVQGMIDQFNSSKEKIAGETILKMLADFDEDNWQDLKDSAATTEWLRQYLPQNYSKTTGGSKMKKYTISTSTLFNTLTGTGSDHEDEYVRLEYGGYIKREADEDREWFDLKTENGTPCMDGETCELLEETEDYVLLQEETERIPFKLSKKEFEIAATLCEQKQPMESLLPEKFISWQQKRFHKKTKKMMNSEREKS